MLIGLLWFCFLVIILYWVWFYHAFSSVSTEAKICNPKEKISEPVSVIISFKNAAGHIVKTVESILLQDYPAFEIIAIDDFSSDGGSEILQKIHDKRLCVFKAALNLPGKKSALTQAIGCAKYDLLLFTDGDCLPASPRWISSMVQNISVNTGLELVLGYSPMEKTARWLNGMVRYETILTAIQYITYALAGMPYMGVGRNMMYRKSLFHKVRGFESHAALASGDDDLFVRSAAQTGNTTININPDSFIYSEGKSSVSSFLQQKSRHISTSIKYSLKHRFWLGLFAACQVGFYGCLFMALCFGYLSVITFIGWLVVKWTVQIMLQRKAFVILDGRDLTWWFPLLDIGMAVYYVILPFYAMVSRRDW
ncbi:MAG: glycosyltransferase [Saprospiraceae bacterium]|nr:glycosyltransferase [Saprospiraceae bacterium]